MSREDYLQKLIELRKDLKFKEDLRIDPKVNGLINNDNRFQFDMTINFLNECEKRGATNIKCLMYDLASTLCDEKLSFENVIDILQILPADFCTYLEVICEQIFNKDLNFPHANRQLAKIYKSRFEKSVDNDDIKSLLKLTYKKDCRLFTLTEIEDISFVYEYEDKVDKEKSIYFKKIDKLNNDYSLYSKSEDAMITYGEKYLNDALNLVANILDDVYGRL